MAKAYWVVCYRSIADPAAREVYAKLAGPAILAAGGRFLARGSPAKTHEGMVQRTVLIEFDSPHRGDRRSRQPWLPGRTRCSGQ